MITTKLFSGMKLLNQMGAARTIREIREDGTVRLTSGTWEHEKIVMERWTAVPEPAPVERALSAGWTSRGMDNLDWGCGGCKGDGRGKAKVAHSGYLWCYPCAEARGAFLNAPQVEPPAPECEPWCGTGDVPEDMDYWGEEGWCSKECARVCRKPKYAHALPATAKPAPVVEAPRAMTCRFIGGSDVPCGGPVEQRKMRRFFGVAPVCQAHMVDDERIVARLMVDGDKLLAADPIPSRPPGLVPQSFGDERIGGVWASRGIRIELDGRRGLR